LTCGFAFKLGHHGVVDVKCGLHTEAHIIDMDIWLGPLRTLPRRIALPELPEVTSCQSRPPPFLVGCKRQLN
jgi:hypothetical protein